jgi:chemotaxis signal transduction protein
VVAQAGDVSVGLRVDAIGEIAEFDRRTLNPAAGSAAGECLEGIFAEGVGLLSVQAILGDGRLLVSDRSGL